MYCVIFLASAEPGAAALKFCSATYRLIKPDKPLETVTAAKQDSTLQVKYKGNNHHYIYTASFCRNAPSLGARQQLLSVC